VERYSVCGDRAIKTAIILEINVRFVVVFTGRKIAVSLWKE
jgi:hypothetical protein